MSVVEKNGFSCALQDHVPFQHARSGGARDQPLAIFKLLKLDRVLAPEEAAAA